MQHQPQHQQHQGIITMAMASSSSSSFGSAHVERSSKTPYSDATQVRQHITYISFLKQVHTGAAKISVAQYYFFFAGAAVKPDVWSVPTPKSPSVQLATTTAPPSPSPLSPSSLAERTVKTA